MLNLCIFPQGIKFSSKPKKQILITDSSLPSDEEIKNTILKARENAIKEMEELLNLKVDVNKTKCLIKPGVGVTTEEPEENLDDEMERYHSDEEAIEEPLYEEIIGDIDILRQCEGILLNPSLLGKQI